MYPSTYLNWSNHPSVSRPRFDPASINISNGPERSWVQWLCAARRQGSKLSRKIRRIRRYYRAGESRVRFAAFTRPPFAMPLTDSWQLSEPPNNLNTRYRYERVRCWPTNFLNYGAFSCTIPRCGRSMGATSAAIAGEFTRCRGPNPALPRNTRAGRHSNRRLLSGDRERLMWIAHCLVALVVLCLGLSMVAY